MQRVVLLLLAAAACRAAPEDLSGKVFVFPKETNRDHVKLLTTKTSFKSVSLCLRFVTDLSRNYGLFSMSTNTFSKEFVLFKTSSPVIRVHARDTGTDFLALSLAPGTWHSVCSTWRSDNGLAQLWVDGKRTIKKFIKSGQPISGTPITILGQDQDTYGGGFDASQSFIGMITKLHMWDYVLTDADVRRYMKNKHFAPGNVFNWNRLDYEVTGQILVDEEPEEM